MPGKCRRMDHATLRRLNHARDRHTDTFTRVVVGEYLLYSTGEFLNQSVDIAIGLKTADRAELTTH